MRGLFWIGVVFVVLGIASLVVPIPHNERSGVKVGGASIGIETRHDEKVSPIISAVSDCRRRRHDDCRQESCFVRSRLDRRTLGRLPIRRRFWFSFELCQNRKNQLLLPF